ncbi:MAG TPA: dienelactone hydrolase family protein, partial [Pirellulaceae bacterium]|nr:dienelactone hydrolase family protein [Pirellulaceae bacterium]
MNRYLAAAFLLVALPALAAAQEKKDIVPLPGTEPLTMEGDIAATMVEGIDRFLLKQIEESVAQREQHWKRDFSSPEAYNKSIEPNRKRLAHILGVRDARVPFDAPELVGTTKQPALVGKGENYEIYAVRWPAVRDVHGEGLLLVPKGEKVADIIAIPDADQTPEQICGLAEGVPPESQFARRLAENGCRVLVPMLINRQMQRRAPPGRQGGSNLTNREYLYRPAFELGRHLIGYEVQKVLAGVDWFAKEAGEKDAMIGVIGYGEGGGIALYSAALDTRIDTCCVSGYFRPHERIWDEPIDRNVFGLLEQFGDAELAGMVYPRFLVIESSGAPNVTLPSEGGGPASLTAPTSDEVRRENARFRFPDPDSDVERRSFPIYSEPLKQGVPSIVTAMGHLMLATRQGEVSIQDPKKLPERKSVAVDESIRHARQMHEIERDTQWLLRESPFVRDEFMAKLYAAKDLDEYSKLVEDYREIFATQVIGRFDLPLLEPKPRSRKSYDTEKWVGYEVVLDVFPDVYAYGILCLPKDLKGGEKRPVVVCQHGLEGRPQDTIGEQGSQYYSGFAGKLADRGFIT